MSSQNDADKRGFIEDISISHPLLEVSEFVHNKINSDVKCTVGLYKLIRTFWHSSTGVGIRAIALGLVKSYRQGGRQKLTTRLLIIQSH